MKQLLLVFLLCIGISFTAKSQTLPLNKQQTLDYLNREYAKINVKYFKKLILDSKVLIFEYKDDRIRRVNLTNLELEVYEILNGDDGSTEYYIGKNPKPLNFEVFIGSFQLKTDATRLKKALEHLIELVKAEKSTDPFDN